MIRSAYDLDPAELAALVAQAGEPPYRARQVARWLDGAASRTPVA